MIQANEDFMINTALSRTTQWDNNSISMRKNSTQKTFLGCSLEEDFSKTMFADDPNSISIDSSLPVSNELNKLKPIPDKL
jgi:hypothetical protein